MPKIDQMFAFVCEDKDENDEGVVAFYLGGAWMPMVGADIERVKSLMPEAISIAKSLNKPIKLIKFTHREEMEIIKP